RAVLPRGAGIGIGRACAVAERSPRIARHPGSTILLLKDGAEASAIARRFDGRDAIRAVSSPTRPGRWIVATIRRRPITGAAADCAVVHAGRSLPSRGITGWNRRASAFRYGEIAGFTLPPTHGITTSPFDAIAALAIRRVRTGRAVRIRRDTDSG